MKPRREIVRLIDLTLLLTWLSVAGCVSTYGRDFIPTPGVPDQYTYRVYVSGMSEAFTGSQQSDDRAKEDIEEFMRDQGYESYELIDRTKTMIPTSYFEYTVRFAPPKAP